jgi:hypothetical protein
VSDITLREAYETAFAVFSPRVSFIEWKMYEVKSDKTGGWWPYYAYRGGRLWDTWKSIDSERWIYVFRRPKGATAAPAVLVDELFLDAQQQLHATQLQTPANGSWPERGNRGAQVAIGKTMCFCRQFLGQPLVHYFFSSRIQLPSKLILELQNHIADWTQGITFEPTDPNIYKGVETEEPRVPVLDPITIATHLHAYYVAASDDLLKYLTPIDDPDTPHSEEQKKRAAERQKKFQLARIISSVLDAEPTLNGKQNEDLLYGFLNDYEAQIKYRKEWRNRWATYLTNWLKARPILLLAEAHQFDEKNDFPLFLLHMANCHSRLSESPQGRELLEEHFEQAKKFSWVQKYALGRGEPTLDEFKAIRKIGSAPLEFLKEHAPVWFKGAKTTPADEISLALKKLFGANAKPKAILWGEKELRYRSWSMRGSELKRAKRHEFELLVEEIHDRQFELKPMWKGAIGSLSEGLELINFALAFNAYLNTPDEERVEKIWAFLELINAGIELSNSTLWLLGKASKHTLEKLSFVSAVIDAVLGAKETLEALSEAKFGKALGSGIITVGSMIVAIGVLAESSFAGPVGFVIVGVGFIIKAIFRDPDDYENFISFSSFGNHEGEADEEPKWYKTEKKFADWGDDLDEQLRAAVMLFCKFKVTPGADPGRVQNTEREYLGKDWYDLTETLLRSATIKMGWVPGGAKFRLKYSEEWTDEQDSREFEIELEFNDEKLDVPTATLSVQVQKGGVLLVQAPKPGGTAKPILSVSDTGQFLGVNKSLKKIILACSLEVKLGEDTFSAENNEEEGALYTPHG